MQAIAQQVRSFIVENFLFGKGKKELSDDDSFLEREIIDSTGVLELVTFLETTYEIKVEDEELVPENLDSIRNVEAFVKAKLESRSESLAGRTLP